MTRKSVMPEQACGRCGRPVPHRPPSRRKAHAFCSPACFLASDLNSESTREMVRKRSPRGSREVTCDQCARRFVKQSHAIRHTNFCDVECYYAFKRSRGTRSVNSFGYVVIYVGKGTPGALKTGHMLEHRWVMQQALGRPLVDKENVHHKNGIRSDNRLENLELWTRSQPLGQRVSDKVAWAKEFLALYEDSPLF